MIIEKRPFSESEFDRFAKDNTGLLTNRYRQYVSIIVFGISSFNQFVLTFLQSFFTFCKVLSINCLHIFCQPISTFNCLDLGVPTELVNYLLTIALPSLSLMVLWWLVVFKFQCLIHIDLSRSKNPAIVRSCCTKAQIFIHVFKLKLKYNKPNWASIVSDHGSIRIRPLEQSFSTRTQLHLCLDFIQSGDKH